MSTKQGKKTQKTQKIKFSKEEEKLLVTFVKNHDYLWDVSSKDFRNTFKKDQAWKECAQLMGGKDGTYFSSLQ